MKRMFLVWIVIALLVVAAAGWFGWTHRHPAALRLQTAKVTKGTIARRIVVAATLQTVKSVDVGSQVSGLIQSLQVDFNSIVKKGQVLARLDPATFQAALDDAKAMDGQAQADLAGYQAALEDAQEKYTRAQALAGRQLIPRADLDAAKIAVDLAVAQVASGQAQVTRARANVEQAQAEVDEADVGAVKAGETATFQVESYPNETFTGTISQVRLTPTTTSSSS